jgi:ribose transport system permease protein
VSKKSKFEKPHLGQFSTLFILLGLLVVVILLIDVFKIGRTEEGLIFLETNNIRNILNQVAINAIIAFGMTLVILVNGIDLSVGSIVALSGVVLGVLFIDLHLPLILSYVVVIVVGAVFGLTNGILITKVKLPPFIVTLGSFQIYRGFAFLLVDGQAKFTSEESFKVVGNYFVLGTIPLSIIIMLVIFLLFYIFLAKTVMGRKFYLVGQNELAAKYSGVKVDKTRITAYALVGVVSAIGGILLASRLGSGSPNVGVGYELDAIAAVVVGGTSFSGGIGTITGTLIGVLILGTINNSLNLLGISPFFQQIARGLIILLAVIVDSKKKSR